MCPPMAVAGAALSVGGNVLQGQAASAASKSQQAAINRQTALSAREFDTRMASAKEGDKRVGDLIDEGFAKRMELEDSTFGSLDESARSQIQRDSQSTDDYFSELGRIMSEQGVSYDEARYEYDQNVEAARQEQAGYRQAADTRTDQLVADSGTAAYETDRGAAANARTALAQFAMNNVEVPRDTFAEATGPVSDEMRFRNQVATDRTNLSAGRQARLAAYGDAGATAGRKMTRAGEDLTRIKMASDANLANLPYQLAPSQIKYANATGRGETARKNAGSALEGKLRLSAAELARSTVPLSKYARAVDDALADYYSSRLKSESDYATNIIGSSQRYEDTNRGLTNYRVANTRGSSTLGDLMTGFGGPMVSAGMNGSGPTWSEVGDKISGWFG